MIWTMQGNRPALESRCPLSVERRTPTYPGRKWEGREGDNSDIGIECSVGRGEQLRWAICCDSVLHV